MSDGDPARPEQVAIGGRARGAGWGPWSFSALAFALLTIGATVGYANFVYMPRIPQVLPVSGQSIPLWIFWSGSAPLWPVLLVGLLIAVFRAGKASRAQLLLATAFAFLGGAGIGSCGALYEWTEHQDEWLEESIVWCDQVRESLERYRVEHGEYPPDLSLLELPRPRPMLETTGDIEYSQWEDGYGFDINVSRNLGGSGASLTSTSGTWRRY